MDEILTSDCRSVRAQCQPIGEVPWRQAMRRAIRDPAELCRRLSLPASLANSEAAAAFPVFVPLEFLSRMRVGDPADPLLRQVLAVEQETRRSPGFVPDPLDEQTLSASSGLLHKYPGRALLVTTGACAIHCRYCFRRHFPYSSVPKSADAWKPAIAQIANDCSIEEVLLSGGDPLTLVDQLLSQLVRMVDAIPHVRRLRFHTRLPIVIPQRVNDELLEMLANLRSTPWVVVHCNHAAELDAATLAALGRLVDAGIPVLNQAVLLRGVNDTVEALEQLSQRLIDHRVHPYYLHQLDRVQGAAHFEVSESQGLQLIAELRTRIPGYSVPQYVREVPGELSKVPVPGPL